MDLDEVEVVYGSVAEVILAPQYSAQTQSQSKLYPQTGDSLPDANRGLGGRRPSVAAAVSGAGISTSSGGISLPHEFTCRPPKTFPHSGGNKLLAGVTLCVPLEFSPPFLGEYVPTTVTVRIVRLNLVERFPLRMEAMKNYFDRYIFISVASPGKHVEAVALCPAYSPLVSAALGDELRPYPDTTESGNESASESRATSLLPLRNLRGSVDNRDCVLLSVQCIESTDVLLDLSISGIVQFTPRQQQLLVKERREPVGKASQEMKSGNQDQVDHGSHGVEALASGPRHSTAGSDPDVGPNLRSDNIAALPESAMGNGSTPSKRLASACGVLALTPPRLWTAVIVSGVGNMNDVEESGAVGGLSSMRTRRRRKSESDHFFLSSLRRDSEYEGSISNDISGRISVGDAAGVASSAPSTLSSKGEKVNGAPPRVDIAIPISTNHHQTRVNRNSTPSVQYSGDKTKSEISDTGIGTTVATPIDSGNSGMKSGNIPKSEQSKAYSMTFFIQGTLLRNNCHIDFATYARCHIPWWIFP